jgi:hypothetical protein
MPNDVPNIQVYEVYETHLENGLHSHIPEYGRIFKHEENCKVGFLSYGTNPFYPALYGPGILLTQGEDAVYEGLWSVNYPSTPIKTEALYDFYFDPLDFFDKYEMQVFPDFDNDIGSRLEGESLTVEECAVALEDEYQYSAFTFAKKEDGTTIC